MFHIQVARGEITFRFAQAVQPNACWGVGGSSSVGTTQQSGAGADNTNAPSHMYT